MRVVGIVQARVGSTRLPGKVLADVRGKPMLARVIERLQRAESIDEVVIATTPHERDRPIAELAARVGCRCCTGDEEDVLARYLTAARESNAGIIVRVTSDCPLIDPAQIDATVSLYFRENADYAANCCIKYLLPRMSRPTSTDTPNSSRLPFWNPRAHTGGRTCVSALTPRRIWTLYERFTNGLIRGKTIFPSWMS